MKTAMKIYYGTIFINDCTKDALIKRRFQQNAVTSRAAIVPPRRRIRDDWTSYHPSADQYYSQTVSTGETKSWMISTDGYTD
jgi:hypothetical protein